jgi:hypothetical protein
VIAEFTARLPGWPTSHVCTCVPGRAQRTSRVLYDRYGEAVQTFGFLGTPAFFLVDASGRATMMAIDWIPRQVEALLKEVAARE